MLSYDTVVYIVYFVATGGVMGAVCKKRLSYNGRHCLIQTGQRGKGGNNGGNQVGWLCVTQGGPMQRTQVQFLGQLGDLRVGRMKKNATVSSCPLLNSNWICLHPLVWGLMSTGSTGSGG